MGQVARRARRAAARGERDRRGDLGPAPGGCRNEGQHRSAQSWTTALVPALLYTGARLSELLGADIEDLGTDRGHRVLRVRRKGGKIQVLALPALAAARIDAYLADRDDVTALPAIPGSTAAARRRVLFATGTGARMYRAEVRALLRHIGRAAGLPAALAGSLSDGGEDIRDIPCYLNAQAGVATGNGVHLVLQQP